MKKREIFKIEGNKINRLRRHCPKCGEGVFLAEHKDRYSCGACGYTEFKTGGRKPERDLKEEKSQEETSKPLKEKEIKVDSVGSEEEIPLKPETEEKTQDLPKEP